MSIITGSSGKARELSLGWCRRQWIACPQRIGELAVSAASSNVVGNGLYQHLQALPNGVMCIGRSLCNSEWCPGYFAVDSRTSTDEYEIIVAGWQLFTTSFDCCVRCDDFEILIHTGLPKFHGDSHSWQAWQGCPEVPHNAIIGGTRQGLPVYIARTKVDESTLIIGGFVPALRLATFNHQMQLLQRNSDFDLLVVGSRATDKPEMAGNGVKSNRR